MAKYYDVKITLVSQLKNCPAGHKVGDEFIVSNKTPAGMCMGAFCSLMPYIQVLKFGGAFFWVKEEGVGTMCCPDPNVVNTFRLQRLPASEPVHDSYDD
ncbi:MAG: TIGR04076 family protein [Candidatus Zixiibacteriota bacterium]|nr:MAG: TIGR04076 family protein [candidate division Zixibacteria bacterium]